MRRAAIDVRSTLDNLANAALLAAEVEQEELEAAAAAPPPSRAGKTSVRTVARRPNKKARSVSGNSSPSHGAEGAGNTGERPLSASASQSRLAAAGSADLEPLGSNGKEAADASATTSSQPGMAPGDPLQSGEQEMPEAPALQIPGLAGNPASAPEVFDPVAAAIRNATEAISTDGAMQAALPDFAVELEDIEAPEEGPSDSKGIAQATQEGSAAYLEPLPPQQLPEQLSLQISPASNEAPPDHLTLQGQSGPVVYPVAADGTVTITTAHAAETSPGSTMMVQQPEGLLIVRDPSTGKERCLGKLLGNSRQTSLILQAANFLEPCST